MTWLDVGGSNNLLTSAWSIPVGVILTSFAGYIHQVGERVEAMEKGTEE